MGSEAVTMALLEMTSPRLSWPHLDRTFSGQGERDPASPKAWWVAVQTHPSSLEPQDCCTGAKINFHPGDVPTGCCPPSSLPSSSYQPLRMICRPHVEKGQVEIEEKAKKMRRWFTSPETGESWRLAWGRDRHGD